MTTALISHPDCLLHEMGPGHPECPERIAVIQDALINLHLKEYPAPFVTKEQLLRVHDENYISSIFNVAPKEGYVALDPDTVMNPHTLLAALRAAGAVVLAVDLVMQKEVQTAFCNIRPPGHHAERDKAMGFCFFNNVAIGVAHALTHYHLQRVAIIDFDVHHGNGTENIFQSDERVLYCSSFQSPFYPFSGDHTQSNHILNIPLAAGTDGKLFREKVSEQWLDKIIEFEPEIIFISAGFDAYIHDGMANLQLVESDYAWITQQLKLIADQICEGRIVSVLEGGYDLTGLGSCVLEHVRNLK